MTPIQNTKEVSNVDMIIYQLKNMIDYHFTKSEWIYLAYAYLYPDDFKDRLTDELIVTSRDTVNNMTAKFNRLKLISAYRRPNSKVRDYQLAECFSYIKLDDVLVYTMTLKLKA